MARFRGRGLRRPHSRVAHLGELIPTEGLSSGFRSPLYVVRGFATTGSRDEPKNSIGIKPTDFEAQMQALKDNGITVVSMEDFLAWRRGEKGIPQKSALISIDDGYLSGYNVAWPILKKFGYARQSVISDR